MLKKEEEVIPPDIEERQPWIYTYADLATLLLAFFIIFATQEKTVVDNVTNFTSNLPGQNTYTPYFFSGGALSNNDFTNTIEQITELNETTDITLDDNGIVVSLNSNLAFESGSSKLSQNATFIIAKFAKLLYNIPNSIIIEGHTDDIPIKTNRFPSNWSLSSSRAASVAVELEYLGIQPSRLQVIGYGSTRPKVRNIGTTARSINRRVDILIKPDSGPPAS